MDQTKAIVQEKTNDSKVEHHVHKERYLGALKENDGKLNEEALGQSIGFSRDYTDKIIEELISDGKIKPQASGTCRYTPTEESPGK